MDKVSFRQENRLEWIRTISIFVFILIAIFAFEYLLEKDNLLRCAVMDDPGLLKQYYNQSLAETLFSGKDYKFRPVAATLYWLAAKISGCNLYIAGYLLLLVNAIIAFVLYMLSYKFTMSHVITSAITGLYLTSRLTYYQVTQITSFTESAGTIFALLTIYYLLFFITKGT